MDLWLVYRLVSDQYGTEQLIAVCSNEETAEWFTRPPGYQYRTQHIDSDQINNALVKL